jgi:AraC family transcriptional regulator
VPGGTTSWLAYRLYAGFRDRESSLVLNGLLLALLGEVLGNSESAPDGRPPAWLRRAEDSLRSRCLESIDLSAVARETGIHPTHFARTFRRYHGCTAGEFVRKLRIEQACRWIEAGVHPLAEIAVRAGFSDQAHFGRQFRRVTGMTPGSYRRLHGANRVPAR